MAAIVRTARHASAGDAHAGPAGWARPGWPWRRRAGCVAAHADGVWLVELAAMPRSGEVAELVMAVMEIRDPGGEPLVGLATGWRVRCATGGCCWCWTTASTLVEQVADLADALLRAAPELRILATSREPLALPGEVAWNVPPLEQDSAVRLFAARAAAAQSDFRLDDTTAPAVSLLCRRLDGIPLALELAATRVRALGVRRPGATGWTTASGCWRPGIGARPPARRR